MGQFAFLFSAMEADVTAGLASLICCKARRRSPSSSPPSSTANGWARCRSLGIALACVGLAVRPRRGGGNVTLAGLGLVLCGALSWACGNLVLRRSPGVNMTALFIWASLVPPLPMLAASLHDETRIPLGVIAALSCRAGCGGLCGLHLDACSASRSGARSCRGTRRRWSRPSRC
jgi:O-acetylserine/cysteine efflux transporter